MLENQESTPKSFIQVLRPNKYMRAALIQSSHKHSPTLTEKTINHLRKLINKQIRINKKAFSIIDDVPPPAFQSSLKFPIKTSRLSPHVLKTAKLQPLPSLTPQPRLKKKVEKKESQESCEENPLRVLQVYRKKLLNRKEIEKVKKRVEIAIETSDVCVPGEVYEGSEMDDLLYTQKGWDYVDY